MKRTESVLPSVKIHSARAIATGQDWLILEDLSSQSRDYPTPDRQILLLASYHINVLMYVIICFRFISWKAPELYAFVHTLVQ